MDNQTKKFLLHLQNTRKVDISYNGNEFKIIWPDGHVVMCNTAAMGAWQFWMINPSLLADEPKETYICLDVICLNE